MSEAKEKDMRVMVFKIGDSLFSLPLLKVKEVVANTNMVAVANLPAFYTGIFNLRGRVVSVIDLKKRLFDEFSEKQPESAVIILDVIDQTVGFLVDSIEFVCELEEEVETNKEIASIPKGRDFIKGIAKHQGKLLQVLNHNKVITHPHAS